MRKLILVTSLLILASLYGVSQSIAYETASSLRVQVFKDNLYMGTATAFIVRSKTQNYLVSNLHVFGNITIEGKWAFPNMPFSPNRIKIFYHKKSNASLLSERVEKLIDRDTARFIMAKKGDKNIDLSFLPLSDTAGDVDIVHVDVSDTMRESKVLRMAPSDRVFAVGYPLGYASSFGFPFWKSGTLASDPDLDVDGLPVIAVDGTWRSGMSGSPVYYVSNSFVFTDGTRATGKGGGNFVKFIGVLSSGNDTIEVNFIIKGNFVADAVRRLR